MDVFTGMIFGKVYGLAPQRDITANRAPSPLLVMVANQSSSEGLSWIDLESSDALVGEFFSINIPSELKKGGMSAAAIPLLCTIFLLCNNYEIPYKS